MLGHMTEQPSGRAAAAILRAWIEPGATNELRVRVTEVGDLDEGTGRTHVAVTSVDEACAIVARWLAAFVAGSGGDARVDVEDERPSR